MGKKCRVVCWEPDSVLSRTLAVMIRHLVKEGWLAQSVTLNCFSPILISMLHLVFLPLPGILFLLILSLVLKKKCSSRK